MSSSDTKDVVRLANAAARRACRVAFAGRPCFDDVVASLCLYAVERLDVYKTKYGDQYLSRLATRMSYHAYDVAKKERSFIGRPGGGISIEFDAEAHSSPYDISKAVELGCDIQKLSSDERVPGVFIMWATCAEAVLSARECGLG